ncbi:unnamed protein product, partial [Closterium sp. Naga37s-1]
PPHLFLLLFSLLIYYPSPPSAPSPSSSSLLSLHSLPHLTLSSASLLSSTAAAGCRLCFVILLINTYPSSPSAPSPSSSSLLSFHSPLHLILSSASLSSPLLLRLVAGPASWGLFSLLPLPLCASALTCLLPYLLSYPCLPCSPLLSLPIPPLAPLLLAVGPPLFSAPLLGFRCPINVAALVPLSPLVLVLWPLSSV